MRPALVLLLILNCSLALGAQPPPASQDEIDHLLSYVDKSGCQFYRNGTWYNSAEARSHLKEKYDFLTKMGWVKSAEDFIERAASKSSMSGEPYQAKCNDQAPIPSARWLAGELDRYRAGATLPPAHPGR
jgi:hypothetical protein